MDDEFRFLKAAVSEPALALRRARRAISPRVAYVERDHDPRHTVLVAGSARSGTTWLAEILSEGLGARLIFEPLYGDKVPIARGVRFDQYLDPRREDTEIAEVLARVLTGRLRTQWTDRFNTVRFPRRRVVKEIRANNLLPWIARHYRELPIVFLLRHPVPSAASLVELGWPTRLDDLLSQEQLLDGPLAEFGGLVRDVAGGEDLFVAFVLRWCIENYVPATMLGPRDAHVVFYEQLVEHPRREIEQITAYLANFGTGRWESSHDVTAAIERPSQTNYRDTDVENLSRVRDQSAAAPKESIDRALEVVRSFGLDRLYGAAVEPLVDPSSVLVGSPER